MKQHSIILSILVFSITILSCNRPAGKKESELSKPDYGSYALKMGETVLRMYPQVWNIEEREEPRWTYTFGLVASAMMDLYESTGRQEFHDYAKSYIDSLVTREGEIKTYRMEDYNIDQVNSGKVLMRLYLETGQENYRVAIETLRQQLRDHPRTEVGGFWHKKRYPHQMWLDGLYMGGPFYAQYAALFDEPGDFDEIIRWYANMERVARDSATGLLYHGWDESREQAWADRQTGRSPNFWGRGMGWYGMALVDIMDFIPAGHPGRDTITGIISRMAEAIVKVQDEETGTWYQVLDQGGREGNFLEGSVSCMFSYFLLKAVNKGYLESSAYRAPARRSFEGIVNTLVTGDADGNLVISPVCAVAGLGGDPYRDGSYEYYINEQRRDNDPKAVGPFIMAAIEYSR